MCVCVCPSIPDVTARSTVAIRRRKLTASSHVISDFDSWICKLKLYSQVMASYNCSHKVSESTHTHTLRYVGNHILPS